MSGWGYTWKGSPYLHVGHWMDGGGSTVNFKKGQSRLSILRNNKRLSRMVKHVAGDGNRTRGPSHARRRVRPLSHGDYTDLTYLSL